MVRSRGTQRARLPRNPGRRLLQLIVALILLWAIRRYWPADDGPTLPPSAETGQVERVIDGDTLKLTDGRTVRVIGVDTPETVRPNCPVEPWGPEASAFTKRMVEDKPIRLELDGARRDRYGRTLAHVWVGDALLAEALLRAGLARAETQYSYSPMRKVQFEAAESEARRAGRGIWSK